MVTRDDVARLAGVSASTVSYVLSGRRSISVDTKQRVLEAMRELNYTPNAFAQGLAGARRGIVALSYPVRESTISPMEMVYVHTAAQAARARGYHLLLWTNPADDVESLRSLVAQQVVDGLVLMEVETEDPRVDVLREQSANFVLLGRTADPQGLDFVDTDFERAARESLEFLLDHGHTRVAFLGGPDADHGRGQGPTYYTAGELRRIAERYGVALSIIPARRTYVGGCDAYETFNREAGDSTAVIMLNYLATLGFLHTAELDGRRVPENLSVLMIGVGGDHESFAPPLTTVTPPVADLTETAVAMLLDHMGSTRLQRGVLLPAKLIDRGSVRSR